MGYSGYIAGEGRWKFFASPDFELREGPALDWGAAARRNLEFLLSLPADAAQGYPRYLTYSWHDTDPQGLALAYPALHFPSFVFLFLAALRIEKDPLLAKRIGSALERTAQAAMRHSDIRLTMQTYTDPKLLDVRGAVESLPDLPLTGGRTTGREVASATGTDDLRSEALVQTLVKTADRAG